MRVEIDHQALVHAKVLYSIVLRFATNVSNLPTPSILGCEDLLTLNHTGKVLHDPTVDPSDGKSRLRCDGGNDDSSIENSKVPPASNDVPEDSTYCLKIPSPIMHDEIIPKSVLQKFFLDQLVMDQNELSKPTRKVSSILGLR